MPNGWSGIQIDQFPEMGLMRARISNCPLCKFNCTILILPERRAFISSSLPILPDSIGRPENRIKVVVQATVEFRSARMSGVELAASAA